MKRRTRHSTALWIVALACLLFGFVPLFVIAVSAGMEFAWLFATEPQTLGWPAIGVVDLAINTFDRVFHEWAVFYLTDGQYDVHMIAIQAVCAAFFFGYVLRVRKTIC